MENNGLVTEKSIKNSRAYELVVKNRNLINGTSLGELLRMSSKGITSRRWQKHWGMRRESFQRYGKRREHHSIKESINSI